MFKDKKLRNTLFGNYHTQDEGKGGATMNFNDEHGRTVVRSDEGLVFFLINEIRGLKARLEELESKKK